MDVAMWSTQFQEVDCWKERPVVPGGERGQNEPELQRQVEDVMQLVGQL